ncbi:MAG: PQQ-dependent sugar dehydrogenase [Candidatus Hydrogenedentota bacterium]
MKSMVRVTVAVCVATWFAGFAYHGAAVELGRTEIASGLTTPVFVGAPPGDSSRIFVVEQPGTIKITTLADNTVLGTDFLDISSRVDDTKNEQGLLGLAFHPNYAVNGYFYLNYISHVSGDVDITHISRFTAIGGPDFLTATTADPDSEVVILSYGQPQWNHNGGMLAFEPRGDLKAYLYIASGDGGGANDTHGAFGNGQNLNTLLGKILRIDVDEDGEGAGTGGRNYDIPPGNPNLGGLPEIWSYGLRNPYRMSFDRLNGDLYIADVGQFIWEEIDHQLGSSNGGENYGWRLKEGPACFNPSSGCDPGGLTEPVFSYDHANDGGLAVIGGYAYRGADIPFIEGHYIFADVSGIAKTLLSNGTSASLVQDWATPLQTGNISSFGEDDSGELYFTIRGFTGQSNGFVYKIIPTNNASIRVDFDASGLMKGDAANPFDLLDTGVRSVSDGGTITLVGNSAVTESNEQLTLNRAMTLTAINGSVRIGVAPADANPEGYKTRS